MGTVITIEFARYIIAFVLAFMVGKIFSNKRLDKLINKLDELTDQIKNLTVKMSLVDKLQEDVDDLQKHTAVLEAEINVMKHQCDKHHAKD